MFDNKKFDPFKHLVRPHKKISKEVVESDLKKIEEDGKIMLQICRVKVGDKAGGLALAHTQINNQDPLRFFVLHEGVVIINPKIIKHTTHKIQKKEGCLSYPYLEDCYVTRYYKVTVEFQVFTKKLKLSEKRILNLKGISAQIMQHEIDHMDGKDIYNQ